MFSERSVLYDSSSSKRKNRFSLRLILYTMLDFLTLILWLTWWGLRSWQWSHLFLTYATYCTYLLSVPNTTYSKQSIVPKLWKSCSQNQREGVSISGIMEHWAVISYLTFTNDRLYPIRIIRSLLEFGKGFILLSKT